MSCFLLSFCVFGIYASSIAYGAPVSLLESSAVKWWSRGLANPSWRPIENTSAVRVDLVFLIDGSGSVESSGLHSFNYIKTWMKRVASAFVSSKGVQKENIRMGVVQFSHHYKHLPLGRQKMLKTVVALGACKETNCFEYFVDRMKIMGYTTFIGAAINKTVLEDFATSQKGTKKILLLLTNGASNDNVGHAARLAHNKSIAIFSVGVGAYNLSELQTISNAEIGNNRRVYQVSTFSKLPSTADDLVKEIHSVIESTGCSALLTPIHGQLTCSNANEVGSTCNISCNSVYSLFGSNQQSCLKTTSSPPYWTGSTATCGVCRGVFDLLFILDSSSSVRVKNFAIIKDFVMQVVDTFEIGPSSVQVSVMTYNKQVRDMWDYNSYLDKDLLMQAITHIYYNGTGTRTGRALRYAVNNKFRSQTGRRGNVPHMTVIVTDGKAQDHRDVTVFAPKLHQHSNVIAVGVRKANKHEVEIMASRPSALNNLMEDTFWNLLRHVRNVSTMLCAAQERYNLTCPVISEAPGSNINCDMGNRVGSRCSISCQSGYKLVGNLSLPQCQKNRGRCNYECLLLGDLREAVWNRKPASCQGGDRFVYYHTRWEFTTHSIKLYEIET